MTNNSGSILGQDVPNLYRETEKNLNIEMLMNNLQEYQIDLSIDHLIMKTPY